MVLDAGRPLQAGVGVHAKGLGLLQGGGDVVHGKPAGEQEGPVQGEPVVDWNEPYAQRLRAAMDDDFNTAEAVAALFELANEVNRSASPALAAQLKALGGVLGLLGRAPQAFLQAGAPDAGGLDADAIEAKIAERAAAKKAKNFADADRIRAELTEAGVILEDGAGGTTWRRA